MSELNPELLPMIESVVKLDADKRYILMVNPELVNLDDLIMGEYRWGKKIVRVLDIEKAMRIIEVPNPVEIVKEGGETDG